MKKRLQVFVSSTYVDLIEERQSAVGAILKSGHIPAGMELFTAGDSSQWDIIKRWIDESDVYMLILGGRYGSVEPTSGVSYTELEYDYAVEIGKPLFAVVIKDEALEEKVKTEGTSVLERDRPSELKLFKQKVLSNMSSFYEDTKDIRLSVMESLPEIAATRELSGWVSGGEVPDTKGLVDEIAKLNGEIASLVKENAALSKKIDSNVKLTSSEQYEELISVLKNSEIAIPTAVMSNGKEGVTQTLYQILKNIKDNLVTGVTNSVGQKEYAKFLYFNICPKLQIHGLVQNEKVASVAYRRFSITKKGQELLAYIERKKLVSE
jgi:hypothetical protein